MWRYSLTPGLISFGPTRVFGGVTGNKVIEFSVKEAAYTWERYNLNITYLWGRYNITQQPTYSIRYGKWASDSTGADPAYAPFSYASSYDFDTTNGKFTLSGTRTASVPSSTAQRISGYAVCDWDRYGDLVPSAPTSPQDEIWQLSGEGQKSSSGGWRWFVDTKRMMSNKSGTTDVRGSRIDQVSSTSSSAYPSNGKSGDYWYTSEGSNTARGNYIDDVTSQNYNQYPDNGISGSYWYIRK